MPQSPIIINEMQNSTTLSIETTSGEQSMQLKRPSTLVLDCNRVDPVLASTSAYKNKILSNDNVIENPSLRHVSKTLLRCNSSSLHKGQNTFVPATTTSAANKFKLNSELDQIFVISRNRPNASADEDDNYDSIEVIDERRMKNMPKSEQARLYKSNTFICDEYYTNEQLASAMNTETKEQIIIEEKRE